MTSNLGQARHASSDPLEDPTIPFTYTARTGKQGRPRIEMEPHILLTALQLGPKTWIARTAKCAPCTIHRRQLDYGIHVPRPNCFLAHPPRIDNSTFPSHQLPGYISDIELDQCLALILQDFPTFGQWLATGALWKDGVRVSEGRVRASLQRIRGVAGHFQDQNIRC